LDALARLHRLIVDDREGKEFLVHRDVFRDPEVFDWEMRHIFEATWVFVGLESQIPSPHDYMTTFIGRQPVVVSRDAGGALHCFINSCRHKGALVCHQAFGTRKYHVCQYHGWAYDSSGRNVYLKDRDQAAYPPSFDKEDHDLVRVRKFASYRGFLFASLAEDVPELEAHLGEARWFLDLVADQGEQGVECVPGRVAFRYRGNWKLQLENAVDPYHFTSTHASYIRILERRQKASAGHVPTSIYTNIRNAGIRRGSFAFARGHVAMWGDTPTPQARALYRSWERLVERHGETRARWMFHTRNLVIFPNVQIAENASLQLRVMRPLSADATEMTLWCIGPRGELAEARRQRIRQYEDFFNPSGLATPDDVANYEDCQAGFAARNIGWQQGYARGTEASVSGADPYAEEIGVRPERSMIGPAEVGDETAFHPCYREWLRLIDAGLRREGPAASCGGMAL
jgi:benzoate/toluate 1,2-dioxygenase subunit alpha